MHFPITAIASILHRISGIILFLLIPFLLWMLQSSLSSEQGFDDLSQFLSGFWIKSFLWLCFAAFIYHALAGVRHLFMDIGIGEEIRGSKIAIGIVVVLTAILLILVGVWLW